MTTSQSNTPVKTQPGPGRAFVAAHGPSDCWPSATCRLYLELSSLPPKHTSTQRRAAR
ncbi:hypothetical protein AB0A60_32905 [Streptomyces sp. NPDC046275]|uniref:hypothetical protein n=1 Tax=Streptomyces sp. NPDC046275 TaxID=3157201 RepID=UPI00340070A5